MQVLVFNLVALDDFVRLKDLMLLDLDHLMDQCLNDADAHVII